MSVQELEPIIEAAWEDRDNITLDTQGDVRGAVNAALDALDSGAARVAEKQDGDWVVNQWLKKAVLLSFRLNDMDVIAGGPGDSTNWWDKVPSKFANWDAGQFRQAGFPVGKL